MMKKIRLTFIILFVSLFTSCSEMPSKLPMGEHSYKLIMNGTEIGSTITSTTISENIFIVDTIMTMEIGSIKNVSRQIIKETLNFEPISFESIHTTSTEDNTQVISWLANFDGKKIILKTDNSTIEFEPSEQFIFDGNFILNEFIAQKFKKNSIISTKMYDPTLEPEALIPVKAKYLGTKKVKINNKSKRVLHLVLAIENFRNIDVYMDSKGVVQKSVMIMLNNRIELVIDPKHNETK